MGGGIVARVGHGPDDRALLLEKLPLLKVVLPQVDLQIPGKGKGGVSPGGLWTAAETPGSGTTVGDGVAWCTMKHLACCLPRGLPSSANDNSILSE